STGKALATGAFSRSRRSSRDSGRTGAGAPFASRTEGSSMRDSGLPRLVGLFALAYALDYALFVLSWWLLGRGVLESPIDFRFLYAWALVLASMLPFRMLSTWSAGAIAVRAGELLKKRLLLGAMRLAPGELSPHRRRRHL